MEYRKASLKHPLASEEPELEISQSNIYLQAVDCTGINSRFRCKLEHLLA
jgi:hypothetical protein